MGYWSGSTNMRIAIDVSQIIYDTGVSVYTRELVMGLAKSFPEDEYILFGGSLRRAAEIRQFADKLSLASVITPISPSFADILWNRLHIVNIEKIVGKVDLFHSSDWSEPPTNAPKVTTIHDLAPLLLPEFTHPKIVAAHKRRLYWVAKESSAVIVPSEASKRDVCGLGIDEKLISVIPEGLRADIKRASLGEIARVAKKYRINGKYAIAIGNNPRKNTQRIAEAFSKAKSEANLSSLVVVGRSQDKVHRGAIYTGHVSTEDLAALYSGASVLVYPSLYEGFGLPILEAFSCKVPVVTSDGSSMAEIASGAAELVDPYSIDSISEGILKALSHKKQLIAKGAARVKDFSWDKNVVKTHELYKKIASRN